MNISHKPLTRIAIIALAAFSMSPIFSSAAPAANAPAAAPFKAPFAANASLHAAPAFAASRARQTAGVRPDQIVPPGSIVWTCPPCVCYYDGATGTSGQSFCCPNPAGTPCDYWVPFRQYMVALDPDINHFTEMKANFQPIKAFGGLTGPALSIAVDLKGDFTAAGTVCNGSNCTRNGLTYFADGSTKPTATVLDPNMSAVSYVTAAPSGTLFVSGQNAITGALEVDEVSGMGSPSPTITPVGPTGQIAGGIALDKKGNLWVADQGNGAAGTITEYAQPDYSKSVNRILVTGYDTEISIDASGKRLSAANNLYSSSGVESQAVQYQLTTGKVIWMSSPVASGTPALGAAFASKAFMK